jgi:hypothetical protein
MAARDLVVGKDPGERWKEENLATTAKDMVDRSGLTFYLAPYIDTAWKLAGGDAGASRFSRNTAFESLLGVNFAQVSQVSKFAASVAADGIERGHWDKVGEKALALAPFAFYMRLFHTLMSD